MRRGDVSPLTDPANLQPKIRPVLRRASDMVRKYPPAGPLQGELDRIVDALKDLGEPELENQIRDATREGASPEAAARIVDTVNRLGLQPFVAPEPLPQPGLLREES
jgi:hypothetical protein